MCCQEPTSEANTNWPIQTDRNNPRTNAPTASNEFAANDQIYFIDDLATLFRTSRRTIDRRRKNGTFPVAELPAIDNKPRWSKAAVMRFLSQSREAESRKRSFSGVRTGRR